jgi:hypothetical protein
MNGGDVTMMGPISLDVKLFLDHGPKEIVRAQNSMLWFLEALVQVNIEYLKAYPSTPALYRSGVVYQREEEHGESWQDIYVTQKYGSGDCEDLACWRTAELRYEGVDAHPFIRWRDLSKSRLYHCMVILPNGELEDPSLTLGMRNGVMHKNPVIAGKFDAKSSTVQLYQPVHEPGESPTRNMISPVTTVSR